MGVSCWAERWSVAGCRDNLEYEVELHNNLTPPGVLWGVTRTAREQDLAEEAWAEYVAATCFLADGHAGAHEFTPLDEITVLFA